MFTQKFGNSINKLVSQVGYKMQKDDFLNSPVKPTASVVVSLALNKKVLAGSLTKHLHEEWDESQKVEESIDFMRR